MGWVSDSAGQEHPLDRVDLLVTLPASSESLGTGVAAHGVAARAEGGSDWVLLAESAGHGTAQSLQLPLQLSGAGEDARRIEREHLSLGDGDDGSWADQ